MMMAPPIRDLATTVASPAPAADKMKRGAFLIVTYNEINAITCVLFTFI